MASVTGVIVFLSETNRPNDYETHQEDISKYRNQQMAWPQDDPNEEQKSNQNPITEYSIASKCVLRLFRRKSEIPFTPSISAVI